MAHKYIQRWVNTQVNSHLLGNDKCSFLTEQFRVSKPPGQLTNDVISTTVFFVSLGLRENIRKYSTLNQHLAA